MPFIRHPIESHFSNHNFVALKGFFVSHRVAAPAGPTVIRDS